MSSAEEFDRLIGDHPELGESSVSIELATTETKSALYALVLDKVGPLKPRSFMRSRKFQAAAEASIFTVAVLRAGSERMGNKLASVGYDSESVRTTIYVLVAPDGLQLQKRVKVVNPETKKSGFTLLGDLQSFSMQEIGLAGALQARAASNQAETELGLDLVSEQEVQELIANLTSAHPVL